MLIAQRDVEQDSSITARSAEMNTEFVDDMTRSADLLEQRVKAQDGTVIEALIELYGRPLKSFLTRLTRDPELAEELLQETWIRVLARGPQFRGESKLSTWLYAIARNLVFDLRRKKSYYMEVEKLNDTECDLESRIESKEKSPFEHCAVEERDRLLNHALRRLTPKQRNLIRLRYHSGLSFGEMATATGLPLTTVKSALYRSVASLRIKLQVELGSSQHA